MYSNAILENGLESVYFSNRGRCLKVIQNYELAL